MSHIFKIVVVLTLLEYHVFQSEAAPSNTGARQLTVVKPTFISTAQFVDRCAVSKMFTRSNMQSQFARARISSMNLLSLKVKSMLPKTLHGQTFNQNARRTPRGKEVIDAVKKNDLVGLSKLIAGHVDVNERDNGGMTALHWAAEHGHIEAAKMLIENNAEIDARDNYFNTPLHIAASCDSLKMMKFLVDRGAYIYAPNLMKACPLKLCTISIENVHSSLMKAAEKGDKLFHAVELGDLNLVQQLIGQGVNINFENQYGETALTLAILSGHKEIADWLVNNGADVNLESCDGTTPIDLAKNIGMSLPLSKTPNWISIITSARNTINKWLVNNPAKEKIKAAQKQNGHDLTWIAYHRLNDIISFLNYLRAKYPKLCSLHTIGESYEGRPLKVLKISNDNKNNKAVWIDGGIHAREWISTSAVTYIANELLKNWNKPHIHNINWYILAVHNPDGYEYSHEIDRLWRKNRAPIDQCDAIGIDLNRNFDFEWGKGDRVRNPNDDTYGGTQAFSQPETLAVKKFIFETSKDKFNAFISFHNYGQYVMYPSDDDKDVKRVGKEGAKRMKAVDNRNYKVGTGQSMFNALPTGVASEWAKSIGIKYSYTIELRDTGRYGFLLPPNFIEKTVKEAKAFIWTVSETIFNEFK
ncbi:mast cell carboxypeptidase A-like [Contarinia nasturtii]|uniref:mast cell carboxypeptidase A-like n=1 Tax=Contarinia nasturtii TaxID=265458 RepID=UPI0012D48A4A|nr:mast cell carboxypeptidase A-like [Contarinia nasturtii]